MLRDGILDARHWPHAPVPLSDCHCQWASGGFGPGGLFAWYPGPNRMRKPHEPCACSPLSGQTYGALVHSSRGGRPTWSDCADRRCGLDGGLRRGWFAWYPGPNRTRKPHEPCACSPLSGQTQGAKQTVGELSGFRGRRGVGGSALGRRRWAAGGSWACQRLLGGGAAHSCAADLPGSPGGYHVPHRAGPMACSSHLAAA